MGATAGAVPKKTPLALRALSMFLLWTATRSVYSLYLGQANSDYRFAFENGFGPAVWVGDLVYTVLATAAVVAIWGRSRFAINTVLAALAVSTSLMVVQFRQVEAHPERARNAYAESRRVRGFPVTDDRLDTMFSPAGRRLTWAVGALFTAGPLMLLFAGRRHLSHGADQ
jgi:hypothetical protein